MFKGSIPSKPAFRSHRNDLTFREIASRLRIAQECKNFCDEPFPNGAVIEKDAQGNTDFKMCIRTRAVIYD